MTEGPYGPERTAARRQVDVAFLPARLAPTDFAIVVDVLRASSTVAAALASGFSRVRCVGSVDDARKLAGPDRLLAGEQDTRPVEGFDLGNSPADLGEGKGRELVLSTTNGTPAILEAVEAADEVLIGSLLNLDAVAAAVPEGADATIVCAGTGGCFSLEDAYTAGRIIAALPGERTDAAKAAERLTRAYDDPVTPLAESAHAEVLREVGQESDIELCARESILSVVPRVLEVDDGAAVVSAASQSDEDDREVQVASSA